MAAHRYWRIYITAVNSIYGIPDVRTIEFLAGGVNVATVAANAYASSAYYPAGNAVMGQTSSDWSANGGVPQWWAYDLGSGSSADISAVRTTGRGDANWASTSPTAFNTQWSDDNVTWITAWSATPNPTAAAQIITSTPPAVNSSPHRYWRINVKSVNSGTDYPAVNKFQLLNAAGTNLATIPANASGAALSTHVASNAIVGQSGFWTADNYAPKSWSYDLGAGTTANIVSVVVTADGTVAPGGVTGAPNSIDVMWSDDGITYTTSWSATPACTSAQLTSTVSSGAAAAPTPAISANPTSVTAGTAGQTIAITGTGLTGASFALSGGLGSIITAQSVASATAASVTLSPGLLGFGALTLTASTGGTASISVATPALGAVAIGFIGDSITAGVNGNPPGTVVTSLTTGGYSVTSVNRGIGGTTTQDWLPSGSILGPAITAIKAAGCTVVLMMLGTNDVRTPLSLTPAQHNANLAQIVQALVSAGLQVVLNKAMFTVPNSGSGSQVWPNDPNSFYRAAWALDCRLANGVNVFCGDTTGFEESQANPQSYISGDGIHPSSAGNTALGQAWAAGWLQRYGPAISRWTH